MSSSSTSQPLALLLSHGLTLSDLLSHAKHKQLTFDDGVLIHVKVEEIITELLGTFNKAQGRSFFIRESFSKFLKKLDDIIQEFREYDFVGESTYTKLAELIHEFKPRNQLWANASHSPVPTESHPLLLHPSFELPPEEIEHVFQTLTEKERKCLFCLLLFTQEKDIKKRELLYWWVGMDLIDLYLEGEELLSKLVALGFLERAVGNIRFLNGYKMSEKVRAELLRLCTFWSFIQGRGSWSILQGQKTAASNRGLVRKVSFAGRTNQQEDMTSYEALLNLGGDQLNDEALKWIAKMRNVKVLHLGRWHHDPTKYIVVEDPDVFKDLKHLKEVRFLSLQGVSGIVELPDPVYKLETLEVLDLRACHNLELISESIVSLQHLTYLDLSECYHLDRVPKGITRLSKLTVLKGFVVCPDSAVGPQVRNNGRRTPEKNVASSCGFPQLSNLLNLRKLTVRTRRMNFPTREDLDTLCKLQYLRNLKITWQGRCSDAYDDAGFGKFPTSVRKLELVAAPESQATLLLGLIGNDRNICIEKLYIRGGSLSELDTKRLKFSHTKVVSLRHLSELHIEWEDFQKTFPNMSHLEVVECPNLLFFPCDQNGMWEQMQNCCSRIY